MEDSSAFISSIRKISNSKSVEQLRSAVVKCAREVLKSEGATFVLREGDKCFYLDEEAISPLWKGQKFPMSACISGWCMLHDEVVRISDITQDSRIPQDAYSPTFVKSLIMAPIGSPPLGALGIYWADSHEATDEEVAALRCIADVASSTLHNLNLIDELRRSETLLRTVITDQTEFVVRWRHDGERIFANDAYCRFFGLTPQESVGTSFYNLVVPEDLPALNKKFNTLSVDNPVAVDVHRCITPHGIRWVEWSDRAIFDPQGCILEYQSVGRDVTDRVIAEQQLRQSQKLEAVGRLAGGITHDLNNYLTPVIGYLDLLLLDSQSGSRNHDLLSKMLVAGQGAKSLLQQLLTFSREQVAELKQVPLVDIVSDLRPLLESVVRENIKLKIDAGTDPLPIMANSGLIGQIVLNLLLNAQDAIEGSGTIEMELSRRNPTPQQREGLGLTEVEYACMSVADDGSGIEPEILERLFEPFFSTKGERGTGLGLAGVYGIVQHLRGGITVESELGVGTKFSVFLPLEEGKISSAVDDDGKAEERRSKQGARLLIIEDDPMVQELLEMIMEQEEYAAYFAQSVRGAWECWEKHGPFDLLISDHTLPDGTGPEFVEALHIQGNEVPVLYLSGRNIERNRSKAPVLQKPFHIEELLEAIRRILASER